jgi:predicted outer membrane protein
MYKNLRAENDEDFDEAAFREALDKQNEQYEARKRARQEAREMEKKALAESRGK